MTFALSSNSILLLWSYNSENLSNILQRILLDYYKKKENVQQPFQDSIIKLILLDYNQKKKLKATIPDKYYI